MAKINGYSREEAESFVKYICQGKGQGKTLTRIFEEYAAATHRHAVHTASNTPTKKIFFIALPLSYIFIICDPPT